MTKAVAAHVERRTITEVFIDPDHAQRKESAQFRKSKERLKEDGHYHCYVCGSTGNLQVHHRAAEWMFDNVVDYAKLKEFCEEWDIYGYGRLLKSRPIESVDDIRNQMVLCLKHHVGKGTGIHEMSFPAWIIQKLAKAGADPVPQAGETVEQAEEEVKENETKRGT